MFYNNTYNSIYTENSILLHLIITYNDYNYYLVVIENIIIKIMLSNIQLNPHCFCVLNLY